jgi:glycolate oxidase FAD binding subunit
MHTPATLSALADLIRDAAARRQALRLVGRGTWLDGGAPVTSVAEPVRLDAFSGILEYEPGDLTITVGAGTTIAEIDAVTAAHRQWCPLAPWGGDDGTVGATISTATAGPFAHAVGAPRDLVLGLECVDGTGLQLRPGGKVVKNVAGFDLTRLLTGAWGTLGAITRVSLRLRALPAVDETWSVAVHGDVRDAQSALRRSHVPPIACETLDDILAARLGLPPQPHVLVRLSGNAAFVAAARTAMQALGAVTSHDAGAWMIVREAPRARGTPNAHLTPGLRALAARVKDAFDPANVLNPGIMG